MTKRQLPILCMLLALAASGTGCNQFNFGFLRSWNDSDLPKGTITTEQLVHYLNENAKRVESLRCDDVQVRVAKGLGVIQQANLDASLICQRPRNFRMIAYYIGRQPEVEIGSNDQEFWYWIRRAKNPAQIYCRYDDLESGRVKHMPFPFQPEWVMEALGMAEFGPADRYTLKETRDEIRLIEQTRSPQGKPVRKIIVFNRRRANIQRGEPQIRAFILEDATTGKEICSARIRSAQLDKHNGALLPREIELRWPAEDISLTLRLINPRANVQISEQDRVVFFDRPKLEGIPSLNLAQLRFNASPSSLRRVRGTHYRP